MATFADLPAELLTVIFRLACDDRIPNSARPQQQLVAADRAGLPSFSLVHSSWTRPAQALLLAYVVVAVHLPYGCASPRNPKSIMDLEQSCRRNPTFAGAIRTVRFSNGAGTDGVPVLPRCDTLLANCPRIVALRIDRSLTLDWNALAPLAGQLRSLAVLSPFFATSTSEALHDLPAFPALEELTISLSELRHLVSAHSSTSLSHPDRLTRQPAGVQRPLLFPALTALNLTSHKASDPVHLLSSTAMLPYGPESGSVISGQAWTTDLPRLSAVACPLALKDELDHFGLPTRVADRVLWHVGWQDFVDYMPPWRTFASTIDEDDEPDPASSSPLTTTATDADSVSNRVRLRHLYLLPLPYNPLPPHFLEELTRRIESDPSLHALSDLWLPKKGWEQHILLLPPVDPAAASNSNSRNVTFWRVCAEKGITLRWIAGCGCEVDDDWATVVDMPEEYRLWALEQDISRIDVER